MNAALLFTLSGLLTIAILMMAFGTFLRIVEWM